jgi:hypothetical protein
MRLIGTVDLALSEENLLSVGNNIVGTAGFLTPHLHLQPGRPPVPVRRGSASRLRLD